MASPADLQPLRKIIAETFPHLAASKFKLLTAGWDSMAVEVDDRLIFKFPRHETAQRALVREASLLVVIRPAVTMRVPDPVLHRGPPLFSWHEKIRGEHLVTEQYERLSEMARQRLSSDLAIFYAELHALEAERLKAAGAGPIRPWLEPDDILRRVWPVLPAKLRKFAERTVNAWQRLSPDPYGTTYGFFDGHGWNMAFDHAAHRLNGIYDFADSGFGQLQQEFIYSNFISRDLTARLMTEYGRITGRVPDAERVDILSGVLRLSELAEYAGDPEHAPAMLAHVAAWANQ